jgi:excisionase family DNA binding protein
MSREILGNKFYTVTETAKLLRVGPQTVRKYVRQGKLKGIKIGRPILISEGDISKALEGSTSIKTTLQK